MTISEIGLFDTVKCIKVRKYYKATNYMPLCTLAQYKNVTGTVLAKVSSSYHVKWQTSHKIYFKLEELELVSKYVPDQRPEAQVLKQYGLGKSYSRYQLFIDNTNYNKYLKVKERKHLYTTQRECFATYFDKVSEFLEEHKEVPNRLTLDQTIPLNDEKTIGGDIGQITRSETARYFRLCKEHSLFPSYITQRECLSRKVTFDLSTISNSLTLYLYVGVLRNLRECPGIIKCALYLYEEFGLGWVDSYLLGNVIAKDDGYFTFFELQRFEHDGGAYFDKAKVSEYRYRGAKHFIENSLDKRLEKYSVVNQAAEEEGVQFTYSYYPGLDNKLRGKEITVGDIIKELQKGGN